MSASDSRVQWGLTIIRPKIDRDTHCKQDFDNIDLPFSRGRVQQSPTIDTGRKQNLDNLGMT